MNAVIAGKSFGYLRPNLNPPCIQVQRDVASWTRETGRANERPDFATRGGNELRQLLRLHAASDYSSGYRHSIRQFDFVGHTLVGLTAEVIYGEEPPLTLESTLS